MQATEKPLMTWISAPTVFSPEDKQKFRDMKMRAHHRLPNVDIINNFNGVK